MSNDRRDEALALLGEAAVLMLQSGDAECIEFARRIPVEFKSRDGAPIAALQSSTASAEEAALKCAEMANNRLPTDHELVERMRAYADTLKKSKG